MKKLWMFPLIMLSAHLRAQDTQGMITYEQVISLDIKESDLPEGMAALIPKEHKTGKVLYFSADAALYENMEDADAGEQEFRQGNMMIRLDRKAPEEITFTDLKQKKVTEQKDLMGRLFLITEDMDSRKWKFTGRQKKLLDLPCMEAICTQDGDTVVAWYTTAIPVSAGPETFSGLPGMILEVQPGAHIHIVATAINKADASMLKSIVPPGKGKKITRREFEKLTREKEEELRQQYGGNGQVIIKHQNVR